MAIEAQEGTIEIQEQRDRTEEIKEKVIERQQGGNEIREQRDILLQRVEYKKEIWELRDRKEITEREIKKGSERKRRHEPLVCH